MKTGILVIVFLLGVAAVAQADMPPVSNPSSRACKATSECVVFYPPCRGPLAVNRATYGDLAIWAADAAPRFHCHVAKFNPANYAVCQSGYCAMR